MIDFLAQIWRSGDIIYCPLGIGGHVDHILTRLIIEDMFNNRLIYYEDIPYLLDKQNIVTRIFEGLHSETIHLSNENVERKIRSISHYGSQIVPLFGSLSSMRTKIINQNNWLNGERIWHSIY